MIAAAAGVDPLAQLDDGMAASRRPSDERPCASSYDGAMHGKRTWRWWAVRFELVLGLAAVLFVGWLILTLVEPTFDGVRTPTAAVLSLVAVWVVMVLALAWMIRIARGPSDEPPPWRYRDR